MENRFGSLFYLEHNDGDKLYPIRMRNRDTGKVAFRVSKGGTSGNTKDVGLEIDDEAEVRRLVHEQGYAVRAKSRKSGKEGLYKVGQRSIRQIVFS